MNKEFYFRTVYMNRIPADKFHYQPRLKTAMQKFAHRISVNQREAAAIALNNDPYQQ